jgi:hypothetical protein
VKTFSEKYRSALWAALLASIVCGLVDHHGFESATAAAIAVYWGTVLFAMWRRPHAPTRLDLILIRWGCIPFVIAFDMLMLWTWRLRGLIT